MRLRLLVFPLFFSIMLCAQTPTTYSFSMLSTFKNNGKDPYQTTALLIDSSGNLYGASSGGGTFSSGTLYKVTTKGALSVLYSFNPNANENGYGPGTGPAYPFTLSRDSKGNLYGTTPAGCCGEDSSLDSPGYIFELKSGKKSISILSSACGYCTELAVDSGGNLFGMDEDSIGCQNTGAPTTVFEVPVGASYGTLYSWPGPNDECQDFLPTGNLVLRNGDVFGAVLDQESSLYNGQVWEWTPDTGLSVIYTFNQEFEYPSVLRQDAKGDLYGATSSGGSIGSGSVFEITTAEVFSTLYSFCSKTNCTDGFSPLSITLDSTGNIYGIASGGGSKGFGVVFKLTPSGTESVLYNFTSGVIGTGLVMDKSGNLYGTMNTANGGLQGVWKLTKK